MIILDKPGQMTSATVVDRVKHLLPRGTKIGHAGTLDRFATGVLILLVGRATRQFDVVMSLSKTYEATIKLGATTPTDDPDSPEQLRGAAPCAEDSISIALQAFVGDIEQVPPVYCALKTNGKRFSDRIRTGLQPKMAAPRKVRIDRIELMDFDWPFVRIRVDCGRGTYIRSLARDLGNALGVGGYLTQLRRTRVGEWTIDQAVVLEKLWNDGVAAHLRSMTLTPATREQRGQRQEQS